MSSAPNLQDRYGTESEKPDDGKKINTLWKYTPSAFDNEKIIELPYSIYTSKAVLPLMNAYQQFNINSIYDPDLTGTGNQPLGRDTWCAIYNYYKVLETHVKCTITPINDDSTGGVTSAQFPTLFGWMADITANPPGTIDAWLMTSMASPGNKQQIFSPIIDVDIINGRGPTQFVHEYHWDASQFDTSIIDNTKNEWTPVGSNPSNLNYFSLLAYNPQGVGNRTVTIHCEIRYLVAFKQINRTLLTTVN